MAADAPSEVRIRRMRAADAPAVAALADRLIGDDYYPPARIAADLARSTVDGTPLCYVAHVGEALVGFRLTFPPGRWTSGRGQGLTPEAWPVPIAQAGYFQSCFVDPAQMGRGIGRRLGQRALDDLRRCGARLAVAHSWKESPHDSSVRYLSRLGFAAVAEHPRYWAEVDYLCSGCREPSCICTAIEMIRPL